VATKPILVVSHSRTGSTARLRDALLDGIADAGDDVTSRSLDATAAGLDDVLAAGAVVFATPARFGALAGLTKDFLERIYPWFDEVPDVRPGMPWTAIAKGASDPTGAVRDLERILTGLRWRQVLPPLVVTGDVLDEHLAAARELGATLAAGLDAGIW
jgi:flavorubredoxin